MLHAGPSSHPWAFGLTQPGPSYRCPSPGGRGRRAIFVSRAGEGKPQRQPEAKNNSRERRNSLREMAREAKPVCVRAEPAASRPATRSHRGSGMEPCPRPPPRWPSPRPGHPGEPQPGTLLLWQGGFLKRDPFTPSAASVVALFGVGGFLEPVAPWVSTAPLLAAPQLSTPSGTQASEFPAKELEPTSKGFAASNLSIS